MNLNNLENSLQINTPRVERSAGQRFDKANPNYQIYRRTLPIFDAENIPDEFIFKTRQLLDVLDVWNTDDALLIKKRLEKIPEEEKIDWVRQGIHIELIKDSIYTIPDLDFFISQQLISFTKDFKTYWTNYSNPIFMKANQLYHEKYKGMDSSQIVKIIQKQKEEKRDLKAFIVSLDSKYAVEGTGLLERIKNLRGLDNKFLDELIGKVVYDSKVEEYLRLREERRTFVINAVSEFIQSEITYFEFKAKAEAEYNEKQRLLKEEQIRLVEQERIRKEKRELDNQRRLQLHKEYQEQQKTELTKYLQNQARYRVSPPKSHSRKK